MQGRRLIIWVGSIKSRYDESDLREGPHGSIWLRTLLGDTSSTTSITPGNVQC